jgi:hypothetical protein
MCKKDEHWGVMFVLVFLLDISSNPFTYKTHIN